MFQALNQIFMKTKIFTLLFAVLLLAAFQARAITVTVGASGTYPSISAAIAGVGTITEPLIIELTTDYAQTSDIISAIAGANATNTVIIRPQSTLTVTGNSGFVWKMDGCQYVTIDGRVNGSGNSALTLVADTTTTDKPVALFITNAANNSVKYLNIKGATLTNPGAFVSQPTVAPTIGVVTISSGVTNLLIDYCNVGPLDRIKGTPTVSILAQGTTVAPSSNIIISNCNIFDFNARDMNKCTTTPGSGVGVLILDNTSNCIVSGNSFYQTFNRRLFANNSNARTCAIAIQNTNGSGYRINDNFIGGSEPLCAGNYYTDSITNNTAFNAIYTFVSNSGTTAIYNNTIKNITILANSPIAQVFQSSAITVNGGNVLVGIKEDGITAAGNIIGDVSDNKVGANAAIRFVGTSTNATFTGIAYISLAGANVKIANNIIAGVTIDYFNNYTTERTVFFTGINILGTAASTISIQNNQIGNNAIGASPTSMSIQNYRGRNNYGIYANTALPATTSLTISGNKINNMYKSVNGTNQTYVNGIWINTAILCPVTITNNEVRDLVYSAARVNDTPLNWSSGITLGAQGAGSIVSNNTISNIQGIGSESKNISGITLVATASTATTSVFSNNIYNISSNVTRKLGQFGAGCVGILTHAVGALTPSFNVYNNMIRLGYDRSGNADALATGYIGIRDSVVSSSASAIANYYGNTIYIGGSNVASSDSIFSMGMCFATAFSTTRNVRNNLVINERSNTSGSGAPANKITKAANTGGIGHYAIGTGGSSSGLINFTSNNNNYVANGIRGVLGRFTSRAEAVDLAAIRSFTNGDLNSISVVPIFVDATGAIPNLRLNQTNYNANEGLKYAAVLPAPFNVDFDGNPRHGTNPTIGSSEYTGLITEISKNGIHGLILSVNGSQITIQNTSAGKIISVYNLSGQNVKQLQSNEGTTSFNMEKGIYLIKINNEVSKIVI